MRWDYTSRFKKSQNAEIKQLQDELVKTQQQLRMVLSSIDEDNLSPDITDLVFKTEEKSESSRGSGQLVAEEYYDRTSGSLETGTFSQTKVYAPTGDGYVFVSASVMSAGGTWGNHRVEITKNGIPVAFSTDFFKDEYSGVYGASASAMIKVTYTDSIFVNVLTSRYQLGNRVDCYYNAVSFGCSLIERFQ